MCQETEALGTSSCWNTVGQHKQAGRAATSWELFLLVRGDMLAAIFHHRLVFNPSKSASLWPHTCASSCQGMLFQSVSFYSNPGLLRFRNYKQNSQEWKTVLLVVCLLLVCKPCVSFPCNNGWFGWIYEGSGNIKGCSLQLRTSVSVCWTTASTWNKEKKA